MWHYGSGSPKRTILYSSSKSIGMFWTRKLSKHQVSDAKAKQEHVPEPCRQYRDSAGRARFHGTSDLKKTETLPQRWEIVESTWLGTIIQSLVKPFVVHGLTFKDPSNCIEALHPSIWSEDCGASGVVETAMPLPSPWSFHRSIGIVATVGLGWPVGWRRNAPTSALSLWSEEPPNSKGLEEHPSKIHLKRCYWGKWKIAGYCLWECMGRNHSSVTNSNCLSIEITIFS